MVVSLRFLFQANDRGDYFPVWGTCLGFEELTILTSGQWALTRTNTSSVSLPLNLTAGMDASVSSLIYFIFACIHKNIWGLYYLYALSKAGIKKKNVLL